MKRKFGVVLTLALGTVFVGATDANAAKKPTNITVKLEEFTITPLPSAEAKAGNVRIKAINTGTLTHEMVLVRAAALTALPKVTTSGGERAVGPSTKKRFPSRTRSARPVT
jgi:hypothetical protein